MPPFYFSICLPEHFSQCILLVKRKIPDINGVMRFAIVCQLACTPMHHNFTFTLSTRWFSRPRKSYFSALFHCPGVVWVSGKALYQFYCYKAISFNNSMCGIKFVAWYDHILVLGLLAGPSHRMHPGWRLGALKNIHSTAKFEYTMHKVKKLKPHNVIFIKLLLKEMGYINILYIKRQRLLYDY